MAKKDLKNVKNWAGQKKHNFAFPKTYVERFGFLKTTYVLGFLIFSFFMQTQFLTSGGCGTKNDWFFLILILILIVRNLVVLVQTCCISMVWWILETSNLQLKTKNSRKTAEQQQNNSRTTAEQQQNKS